MSYKYVLASILLFICPYHLSEAQEFGGHPPTIKWYQINTDHIRLIFPQGQDEEAMRITNLIHYLNQNNLESVGSKTKKIDLVLQTSQVISNGYVSLMPFRSELFATPFQNNHMLGSGDFLDLLAIHEYRHTLQFTNANRGATKFFHLISGQPGWTGLMNLSIPNWYFEGDAVMEETVLSSSGRGRTPDFFKEQRALLLNDTNYSYMKARNGSYRDMVPSHYPLGYVMINYGRKLFGPNIWKDILADAGAYRSVIYPFSGAMNIHTGMRAPEMYQKAYSDLKTQWTNEIANLDLTKHIVLTPKNPQLVTDNQYANFLNDGSIVYNSSSYAKTPALYLYQDGIHTKITSFGVSTSSYISETNGKLIWSEFEKDPRWANRNYTRLISFDLEKRVKQVLVNKSKLFSPTYSNSGNKVTAVLNDDDLTSEIVILSAATGKIDRRLATNPHDHISYPKWTKDDRYIIYVSKRNGQIALLKYDLDTNQIVNLTPWSNHIIGNLSVSEDAVFFSASYTGIDNIFSVSLNGNQQINQLTSVKVGAYQPDISSDGQTLVMSEYTDKGYILTSLTISEALHTPIELIEPSNMEQFQLTYNESDVDILSNIPTEEFSIEEYNSVLHGTKLHTWGIQSGTSLTGIALGFSNTLNTFTGSVFGGVNNNEGTFQMFGNVDYGKYFTVISLGSSISDRNTVSFDPSSRSFVNNEFSQYSLNFGLSVPLDWQIGNYSTGLTLESDIIQYWLDGNNEDGPLAWEPSLSFYNVHRRARQNLQPKFGQYLFANYAISLNDSKGERFNVQAGVFLPSLFNNHGILVEAEYQKELLTNVYQFTDFFNYARGYNYIVNEEASRLSINYRFPLLYPDWGFYNFAYFKRIRTNLFYDVAETKISFATNSIIQKSYGIELNIDNVMINLLPVSFIFRQSFLPDAFDGDPSSNFQFYFQVSL